MKVNYNKRFLFSIVLSDGFIKWECPCETRWNTLVRRITEEEDDDAEGEVEGEVEDEEDDA